MHSKIIGNIEYVTLSEWTKLHKMPVAMACKYRNKGYFPNLIEEKRGSNTWYWVPKDIPRPPEYIPYRSGNIHGNPFPDEALEFLGKIPDKQICEIFGVDLMQVRYRRSRLGLDCPKIPVPAPFTKEELAAALSGNTLREAAQALGTCTSTISKYARQWGLSTNRGRSSVVIDGVTYVPLITMDWGITRERKRQLWDAGRIPTAIFHAGRYFVPEGTPKPECWRPMRLPVHAKLGDTKAVEDIRELDYQSLWEKYRLRPGKVLRSRVEQGILEGDLRNQTYEFVELLALTPVADRKSKYGFGSGDLAYFHKCGFDIKRTSKRLRVEDKIVKTLEKFREKGITASLDKEVAEELGISPFMVMRVRVAHFGKCTRGRKTLPVDPAIVADLGTAVDRVIAEKHKLPLSRVHAMRAERRIPSFRDRDK